MALSQDQFYQLVQNGQLVSVDLLIRCRTSLMETRYLFGYRKNEPAGHTWFVPGGRVRKLETIEQGLKRVALEELGLQLKAPKVSVPIPDLLKIVGVIACLLLPPLWTTILAIYLGAAYLGRWIGQYFHLSADDGPQFLGVYEHIYSNNFLDSHPSRGQRSLGTHYVVFCYVVEVASMGSIDQGRFKTQHQDLARWLTKQELLKEPEVHPYCKCYFQSAPPNIIFRNPSTLL